MQTFRPMQQSGWKNTVLHAKSFFLPKHEGRMKALHEYSEGKAWRAEEFGERAAYRSMKYGTDQQRGNWGGSKADICLFNRYSDLMAKHYRKAALAQERIAERCGKLGMHAEASWAWGRAAKMREKAYLPCEEEKGMEKYELAMEMAGHAIYGKKAAKMMKDAYETLWKFGGRKRAFAAGEAAAELLHRTGRREEACRMCMEVGELARKSGMMRLAERVYRSGAGYAMNEELARGFLFLADLCSAGGRKTMVDRIFTEGELAKMDVILG